MKFLSISNVRKHLADLVGVPERAAITRNGEPMSVLLSIDDYRALVANQVLAKDPEILRKILEDHKRVQAGDLSKTESFDLGGSGKAAPSASKATPKAKKTPKAKAAKSNAMAAA